MTANGTKTRPASSAVQPKPRLDIPVLVGITEIHELLPLAKQTVYRWRSPRGSSDAKLPAPVCIVSKTPVWDLEDILALAEREGLTPDAKALKAIRKDQGRG